MLFISALTINKNNKNEIIQEFLRINFHIIVETTDKETCSHLFFIKKNEEEIIPILDGVICKVVNNKKKRNKVLISNFFVLTYPNKYIIYYDTENNPRKTNKSTKIYMINCEIKKSYQIYNYKQISEHQKISEELAQEFAQNYIDDDNNDDEENIE
ncbi:10884_t:CDS:1 [Scutellospora calospora]|uniref:10884_t:CDS:1 n=1 Tax=Scutellospora calospora TaxID=85575 RepID=A0ACA9M0A3_9GLOM|nr:10884_t:CDS:1 [Scutellospora calospora]